jgi:hypothetical protein
MLLQPCYSKIKTRDGRKFYGPAVLSLGKMLHLKRPWGTAVEAMNYSRRFCARFERLKHAQKEIPGNQG